MLAAAPTYLPVARGSGGRRYEGAVRDKRLARESRRMSGSGQAPTVGPAALFVRCSRTAKEAMIARRAWLFGRAAPRLAST